jgi:hypothetical protein
LSSSESTEHLNFWKDSAKLNSSCTSVRVDMVYIHRAEAPYFGFQIVGGWNVFDEVRKTNWGKRFEGLQQWSFFFKTISHRVDHHACPWQHKTFLISTHLRRSVLVRL